ncbi:MAG: DEAD/DEAH box helicase, partial [Methylobacteriaceae bacterium]|nr:DEAD/DEAH box helicase [Methylobacteriaceae bacterium]
MPLSNADGALALRLATLVRGLGASGLLYVVGSEGRAERLVRLVWRFAPDLATYLFPPWDCLPYDRVSPSPRAMGLRSAALADLAAGSRERPLLVVATAEALVQRVPPRAVWAGLEAVLTVGEALDLEALARELRRLGYRDDERVDETGEFAIRGQVIDVFPAGYSLPVRLEHEDGAIRAIASYDAATQRSTDAFERLRLRPVSEAVTADPDDEVGPDVGREHRLPEIYPRLETILDYVPDAAVAIEPRAAERGEIVREQIRDAYESRLRLPGGGPRPLPPERLYLDESEGAACLAGRRRIELLPADQEAEAVPNFALERRPSAALARFVEAERGAGRKVVLAAADARDRARLARAAGATDAAEAAEWAEIAAAGPGSLVRFAAPLDRGFRLANEGVTAVAAADLLGSRAGAGTAAQEPAAQVFDDTERFRIGDAVIHLDHGVGLLAGLDEAGAAETGPAELVRLTYANDARLLVPIADLHLMWRYGGPDSGLTLDRLDGESWPKRRAKVEAEINRAAAELARLAEERRARRTEPIKPPARAYERFVARFAFAETADQRAAVDDILRDLASGRPMDRLVCGDVGFGKTEVALRAAAAVALAGRQVAITAPTTVLARQHLDTLRRRFAGFGIEIGHLSRLVSGAEAKAVKDGLASGEIRVVVGTHALAGKGVAFADLGLLVIDEEQRFGAADKEKLRALGQSAHTLTLTATPIPRTMQSALAGLQDLSVLATPPAERQPVRTFAAPFDPVVLREALMRERRRQGQSFVVCPRVEDIAPLAAQLAELVPELQVALAHGKLPAAAIDDAMVRFAGGEGDVLLATNIIESGLDVPR